MRFICQIAVPRFLEVADGTMAYIFVTHAEFGDETFFDPDVIFPNEGENAVILQPGKRFDGPTKTLSEGPTLYMQDGGDAEFMVTVEEQKDPEFVSQDQFQKLSKENQRQYFDAIMGDKIGGTPAFFQGDDWPGEGEWHLLLQLNPNWTPFYLNLGASPQAMAFVDVEAGVGKLLVQDS